MRALAALTVLAAAGSALAQDSTDDWDSLVQPEKRLTAATVQFGGSIGIAVRCLDGGLDALITGLPPAVGVERREILVKFDEDEVAVPTFWNVAVDPAIGVSERPAGFARALRQGGRLDIVVPGAADGGRNLRFAVDLPAAHASLDRTLEACGKPLDDPRDAELAELGDNGLPGGVGWARAPNPAYPSQTRTYERGFAVITCLAQPDGRLRLCEIETEHPRDGGFGDAALVATRRARLENLERPGQPISAQKIMFRASFALESVADSYQRSTTSTRLPTRSE